MYNGASRWGQAFNHWGLAMFFAEYTWLCKGVIFVFLLSFPLSLPFDWTLRCWVCVCCFVLFCFILDIMLCCVWKNKIKIVDNKKKKSKTVTCSKNQQSLHRQQRHTEPVASHSDHHWLQAPATGLWWWSIPPRYTQPLLFTVWNAEWHTCAKTAHTSQRPGALSVCSQRKEDPIQD